MKLEQTLTKENFFDEMMKVYPLSMKKFCEWIDAYKKEVNWDMLFFNNRKASPQSKCRSMPVKFHDIPYDMQAGIWINFANEILNELFEQPEYHYMYDLEEDIKKVFSEIEPIIREYPEN